MAGISTHVLDTARGRPAAGVPVRLDVAGAGGWSEVATATTDADGRVPDLLGDRPLDEGRYRIRFDTAAYLGEGAFFPEIEIVFAVSAPDEHHHVPLLLSTYGYTTYRGS